MPEHIDRELLMGVFTSEDLGECDNGCGPAKHVFEVTDTDGDTHTIRLCQSCYNAYHHESN